MRTMAWTTVFSLLAATAAFAQAPEPPPYLDDRSDATALVKSFYNAVSRREYARAWDYFGEQKPSKDFKAFVDGYSTAAVRVVTGQAGSEGAAGSIFYALPVALLATNSDGSEQVFAGCYFVRSVNPALQEPPFKGLSLERAELKASEQPFEEKLPEKCGDGPTPEPRDAVLDQAQKTFVTLHASECEAIRPDGTTDAPETHSIAFRYSYGAEDDPESTARLFRFYCGAGAYNESHVYYLHTEVDGLRELQFATPDLDIRYEGDDQEGKVESVSIIGYKTDDALVNSSYDDATKSITSYAKWRGVGDASSSGTWIFRDGSFSLVKYDVDASYDGEINPETVLDFHTGP